MTRPLDLSRFLPETVLAVSLDGVLDASGHKLDGLPWTSPHLTENDCQGAVDRVQLYFPAWRLAAAHLPSLRERIAVHMCEAMDRCHQPVSESERQTLTEGVELMRAAGLTAQLEKWNASSFRIFDDTRALLADA